MKIAINKRYIDKLPATTSKDIWREFNGSFENLDISPRMFLAYVKSGYAYSPQHIAYRKSANFFCGQHLATDHDTDDDRSSIQSLAQNPFIRDHAYAIHATPSSTPEKPRSRVIFVLDEPIMNRDKYSQMTSGICHKFNGLSDQTTKDVCRFFFGRKGAETLILGNTLSLRTVALEIVKPYLDAVRKEDERKRIEWEKYRRANKSSISDDLLNHILSSELDKIALAPDGEKYTTLLKVSRTMGGYVGGGYWSYSEMLGILTDAISRRNIDSRELARGAIISGLKYGMGQPLYVRERDPWNDAWV